MRIQGFEPTYFQINAHQKLEAVLCKYFMRVISQVLIKASQEARAPFARCNYRQSSWITVVNVQSGSLSLTSHEALTELWPHGHQSSELHQNLASPAPPTASSTQHPLPPLSLAVSSLPFLLSSPSPSSRTCRRARLCHNPSSCRVKNSPADLLFRARTARDHF